MASSENEIDAPQVYLLGKTHLANNQAQFYIRNDPIVHMAAGDRHTIIITASGRAFAFGDNSSGQLGLGHTNSVEKVSCIKSLKFGDTGERVILAACGRESSLVATNHGSIYAFGSNSRYQLAMELNESLNIHHEPVKIEHFREKLNWKQISMGAEHACALTDDGQVYVWGSNEDGQCGQPRKQDVIKAPRELRVALPVIAISCGYYHTAIVNEKGQLYLFGNNDDRQLGRSVSDKFAGPMEVTIRDKVKAVACGHQHTVVLTDQGEVFACGHGDRGQLGLGSGVLSAETFEPIKSLPKRLTDIAAGEGHTAVLSARGDLYVFGDGKHGKLGSTTHSNEFQPCLVEKFKLFNVSKVVCGGYQTIVLAQKRDTDLKKTHENDEDIGNTTLSITQQPKSRARTERNRTITDRMQGAGDSMDSTMQTAKPLATSNHLRTERNHETDEDKSDKELSESLKSATFNQTHTLANGRFRPTQTLSLPRTTLRTNDDDDDMKPIRTGALDRTVRLNKETDDLTKTNNRLPSLDKTPVRNTRLDHTTPSILQKKQDSDDDDKSPVRNSRFDRTSPTNTRKKQDSDDDKSPVRNTRFDRTSPPNTRKNPDSLNDKSPIRNTRLDRTNPQPVRKKPLSDEDKSSEEEVSRKQPLTPSRSFTKKPEQSPRNDRRNSPDTRRNDDNGSDDNKRQRPSPMKTPMSEVTRRKSPIRNTRQQNQSEDEDEDEEDDDDDDDEEEPSSSRKSKPPPVARRSSLPPQTRPGASGPTTRDGNQTIGSKPVDGVRGSFRSPATKTLAKPNAPASNTDLTKKETPPAQQPGFFSRLFGSKSTPPPPPPPPVANATSKACSIM